MERPLLSGATGQSESELGRQAARLGLARSYVDARGDRIEVPDVTLRALVEALSDRQGTQFLDEGEEISDAPRLTYQGANEGERYWLLTVQLYAVRSATNWGHGDFTDLKSLLELAAKLGAAGIGVNPLHALLHETDISPYSPSSRLFLNFLYIDVEALSEFPGIRLDDLRWRIEPLRSRDRVDYREVKILKEEALRRCFAQFCSMPEDPDFALFCVEGGERLQKFAEFENRRRVNPGESGAAVNGISSENDTQFYKYVQWRADHQLRACRDKARALNLPVGLYVDLAVGVRPDGADVSSEPDVFLRGVSIGAPPDPLNVNGQDWGLTTYRPQSFARQHLESFRRMLAANMRCAGALRVDHVLWLNRLYLIPAGMRATEGSYVRYPIERLLSVLAIESNARRCIVIGEDLGTVPEELRTELRRWGVWTYHVMQFERTASGEFRSAHEYQERALATFSTHDLPPFAAWLSGADIAHKQAIGIDPGETERERKRSQDFLSALLGGGKSGKIEFTDVADFLARTPSRLVAVSLEEALGFSQLANVPGTTTEHPNWQLRMPMSLEKLTDEPSLAVLSELFLKTGRSSRCSK